jgi:serine/threonine-protein kinase RsbW
MSDTPLRVPGLTRAGRPAAGVDDHARLVTPLSSGDRTFPGTSVQIGAARRFVGSLLDGSPLRDDAIIVVSELFTNALQHSDSGMPGGLVVVQVSLGPLGAGGAVPDLGAPARPVIRNPHPDRQPAPRGNGLYLVSRISAQLDWDDDAAGRTVTAVLGTLQLLRLTA